MFQRDEALALSIAGVIAFLVVAFAVLAGALTPASERSAQPACSEWTDGCVVCARRPEGLACSTPGIACTRNAPKCLKP